MRQAANMMAPHGDLKERIVHWQDRVVCLMMKSLFDQLDQLFQTHPAAKDISVKTATTVLPIPLYAGAERYYRGISVLK
jgi:TRAP-type uncharacterized transport system substrate-binding protein